MDDAKHDDLIGHRVEIDRVRKASHERAACVALDARVRERGLGDTGKQHVDCRRKGSTSPGRCSSYQSRAASSSASAWGRGRSGGRVEGKEGGCRGWRRIESKE